MENRDAIRGRTKTQQDFPLHLLRYMSSDVAHKEIALLIVGIPRALYATRWVASCGLVRSQLLAALALKPDRALLAPPPAATTRFPTTSIAGSRE